jgi:CRISPR-associated protein Csx10
MKKVGVLIKNQSPIILGEKKWYSEKFLKTRKYIPGAYLRGAITDQLLHCRPNLNYYFDQLICDSQRWGMEIVFPNCYPNLNAYTFPMLLPATAKSCRWKPGFVQDSNFDGRHGVFDTLLNQIIFQQALASSIRRRQPTRSLNLIQDAYRALIEQGTLYCSVCHEVADSYQVEYAKPHGKFMEIPVRTYWQTESDLPRNQKGGELSADQGQSIESINERTWFLGFAFLPADQSLLTLYRDSLENITHLGETGDQGAGKVEIKVREIEDHSLSIRQRILKFNQKYRQLQEEYSLKKTDEIITINLQSEAILKDQGGRPTTRLSASILIEELRQGYRKISGKDLSALETGCTTEVTSFSRPVYVGGWNSQWKSADDAIPAIARGSVFVFSFSYLSAELLAALEYLEKNGIGENRREGYGQIMICDPFHLETPSVNLQAERKRAAPFR